MAGLDVLAAAGAVQCILVALVLWSLPNGNRKSNAWLGIVLVCEAASLMHRALGGLPKPLGDGLALATLWAPFALPAAFWLYVVSLVDHRQITKASLVHFLPALGVIVFVFAEWQRNDYSASATAISATDRNSVLWHAIFPFIVAYSLAALRILWRHQRIMRNVTSEIQISNLNWLALIVWVRLIFVVLVIGIEVSIRRGWLDDPGAFIGLRRVLDGYLFLWLVIITAIRQPLIFSDRYQALLLEKAAAVDAGLQDLPVSEKYRKSGLKEEEKQLLWERLGMHLIESKAYLQPELRISELAAILETNVGYLSQTINEIGGMNFYDLINSHRVAHAAELLASPQQKRKSVIDIGFVSGFSSQSAYYKAFKSVMGDTPAVFRRKSIGSPEVT